MKNQSVLFVMSDQTPDSDVAGLLEQAATQNARVICQILAMTPEYPINAFGALPYGAMDVPGAWIEKINDTKKRLLARTDEVEALLRAAGASGDVQPVHTVPANVREAVARQAMTCDVATVAESLRAENPDVFRAALYGILFDSPVGLVLNGSPLAAPQTVFLAWNSELPAARAVHAALPTLKAAKEIVVGVVDPKSDATEDGEDPGADIARWLSHHGCNVTVNQYPSGGGDIAATLTRRAAEAGADLIVMGAYGHSRTREYIFGGTTRSMLAQTDARVFMVH